LTLSNSGELPPASPPEMSRLHPIVKAYFDDLSENMLGKVACGLSPA
jgi:hypothetical protein